MYDREAKDADAAVFKGKHKELRKLAEPIFERAAESKARPEALATARKSLTKVRGLVSNMTESKPWIAEDAKEDMLAAVTLAEEWMDEKEALQKEKVGHEEAAFHSTDVPTQLKDAASKYEKLVKTPKPAPPKPASSNTTTNGTTTDNESDETKGESVKININVDEDEDKDSADADAVEGDSISSEGEGEEKTEGKEDSEAEAAAEGSEGEL